MRYLLLAILVLGATMAEPLLATESSSPKPAVSEGINEHLELSRNGFDWHRDWWKYLSIVIGCLLALFLAIRITKMLFHLIVFAACLVVGILGSVFLSPYMQPFVSRLMTEEIAQKLSPGMVAHALTFLLCYFIALVVMWFIHRPMKKLKKDIEQ